MDYPELLCCGLVKAICTYWNKVAESRNVQVLIVAINKIDLPSANVDKVYQELTNLDLLPEEWGGKTIVCKISARENIGIDKLLEMILIQAEMLTLRANPNRIAKGTIIEAKLDPGRGAVATGSKGKKMQFKG